MSIRLLARAIAGFGLCASALTASAYSSLVVFGDSLSDSGNNAALLARYYASLNLPVPGVVITDDSTRTQIPSSFGTYSNGPVWTQYLAQSMGVSLAPSMLGGTNYAYGGAQTGTDGADLPGVSGFPPSMRTQLNSYMGTVNHLADPNALYVLAGGGNNIRVLLDQVTPTTDLAALATSTATAYAQDIATQAQDLMQAGARHVLVLNVPNYGLTPWIRGAGLSTESTLLSQAMNQALGSALQGSPVQIFDTFSFLTAAVAAGPASGFSDVLHACGAAVNACDESTSLFWDGVHPTTLGQQRLAEAVFATAVPEPATTALMALGLGVVALGARRRARLQQR